jgi:hypothetical protein
MSQKTTSKTVRVAQKITLLLLSSLILVLGLGVYLYYYSDSPQKTFATRPESSPTIPHTINTIASTTSAFINHDHNLTFQHPSDWNVTITKEQENFIAGTITSPNNLIISFINGPSDQKDTCKVNSSTDMGNEPITVFGKTLNLHYYGDKEKDVIANAFVVEGDIACPSFAFFEIPEIITRPNGESLQKAGSIKIAYKNSPELPHSTFMSEELLTAKEIISSFALLSL